ncbi:protein RICE SALT SENSITIVE 3 [Impatiens glandulifera]|uniref:protein RICE SALT SENSITIVE 3 n=1 Tax=Impatiens glandulifera TaxID=253017 RepID=UPI001FB19733|nr:protein RICE SALT SENSITIVE 3 [Impatiens glandulifera]
MVGSGSSSSVAAGGSVDRSKEAVGMMALHEALTNVCLNSEWIYSIFWTIRQRPRVRGGNGSKLGEDNGSLMLMWEDGYCRGGRIRSGEEDDDAIRKSFAKMSIQLYNYGEGLMGKIASDKCHKWVFKEPMNQCETSNYWQSSFDAIPTEWTDQFESGIQTVAVIQAGHGLLQLGSCKIIAEDLHFVLKMRHTFESLGYQSGFYLSHLFSSSSPSSLLQINPQQSAFNWGSNSLMASDQFPIPSPGGVGFLNLHSSETHMIGEHDQDSQWENKFKRSFTLPARMISSSMAEQFNGGMNQHQAADFMDPFLE